MAFSDIKKMNIKKHVNNIANMLLSTEKDGFGYTIKGKQGMFGEKTINTTFKSRIGSKSQLKFPNVIQKYETFGIKSKGAGPALFHGRHSTNEVSLQNTHPIKLNGWNLIHNGVVSDKGPEYEMQTNNDSEHVLFRLIAGIGEVEKYLEGYYAFAAIDPEGRLHICRDDNARLFAAWSESYECYIFATTELILEKLDKMISAKLGPIDEIEENIYMIFNGNELVHSQTIKPLGYSRIQSMYSQNSIGRQLYPGQATWPESDQDTNYRRDLSEAEWQGILNGISSQEHDRTPRTEINETSYYKYRREVDNMDSTYTIYDPNDNQIELEDFRKLLSIDQEQCHIVRPDGSMLEFENDNLSSTLNHG